MNEQARECIRLFDDPSCLIMVSVKEDGVNVFMGRIDQSACTMKEFVQDKMGNLKHSGEKMSVEFNGFNGISTQFEWTGTVQELLNTILDIWVQMAN